MSLLTPEFQPYVSCTHPRHWPPWAYWPLNVNLKFHVLIPGSNPMSFLTPEFQPYVSCTHWTFQFQSTLHLRYYIACLICMAYTRSSLILSCETCQYDAVIWNAWSWHHVLTDPRLSVLSFLLCSPNLECLSSCVPCTHWPEIWHLLCQSRLIFNEQTLLWCEFMLVSRQMHDAQFSVNVQFW